VEKDSFWHRFPAPQTFALRISYEAFNKIHPAMVEVAHAPTGFWSEALDVARRAVNI